jgi:hypothetical protein
MIFSTSPPFPVIPAKAGIQKMGAIRLDFRLRGNDSVNWGKR